MDPYLEGPWRDVHHSVITYMRDALQECLPPDLVARVDERIIFELSHGMNEGVYPDVRLIERAKTKDKETALGSEVAVAEPFVILRNTEPLPQGYIDVIDVNSGNRVVTSIELLSPSNKYASDGRDQYQRKQQKFLSSTASLVEIDLLRAGPYALMVPLEEVPPRLRATYKICVHRGWEPNKFLWYAAPLQERLPVINIPLRQTDPEVPLDLQALIDQCYHRGRYELDFDYRKDPEPPLSKTEAAWADELLRGKGLRTKQTKKKKGKRRGPKAS